MVALEDLRVGQLLELAAWPEEDVPEEVGHLEWLDEEDGDCPNATVRVLPRYRDEHDAPDGLREVYFDGETLARTTVLRDGPEVAVTATRKGLTDAQLRAAARVLRELAGSRLHHGACLGGDEQLAYLGLRLGYRVVAHPGADTPYLRLEPWFWHVIVPELPNLERNNVLASYDVLIACPAQDREVLRSGTWSTVRRAKRRGTRVVLVRTDGATVEEVPVG